MAQPGLARVGAKAAAGELGCAVQCGIVLESHAEAIDGVHFHHAIDVELALFVLGELLGLELGVVEAFGGDAITRALRCLVAPSAIRPRSVRSAATDASPRSSFETGLDPSNFASARCMRDTVLADECIARIDVSSLADFS